MSVQENHQNERNDNGQIENQRELGNINRNASINIPLPKGINMRQGDLIENVKLFKRQWQNYLIASGLRHKQEEEKIAILLTAVGDDVFKRYVNFDIPEVDRATEVLLLEAIIRNLAPTVNIRHERGMFNLAKQQDEETYTDYFNRLQDLIKNCNYGEVQNELMLDKIICSIKDKSMMQELWLDREITLQQAIDKCKAKELAEKQFKELNGNTQTIEINKFISKNTRNDKFVRKNDSYKGNQRSNKEPNNVKCIYCGYEHIKNLMKCPARGAKCRTCNKLNHFAKVCRMKQHKMINEIKNHVSNEILTVTNENTKKNLSAKLKFIIGESEQQQVIKEIDCILDTGAACDVIGLDNLCRILQNNNPNYKASDTKLKCFGGNIIKPLGEIWLSCLRDNKVHRLKFQIVNYKHCPLISAETCEVLGLIKVCNKITDDKYCTNDAKQILLQYEDVFQGLGCLEGEVSLEIDENIQPNIQTPRRIPMSLRNDLKEAIDDMIKLDVIQKQERHTDWVSNVVIVKRKNKSRMCLDPRHLNKALKDVKYQMPTIEEILPELKDAKVFSTFDAKHGFWQIKLNEESSKLTTFWTPFGRYSFKRLPFGIAPAMEIYQKRQHEILQGLPGVEVMADDILVYGRGNKVADAMIDHNNNLRMLMERLRKVNLKLNKEKVKLCMKETKYYGHILTEEGVKPDEDKVKVIVSTQTPKSKAELLRFLGMVTYLAKFMPNLSADAEVLRKLTHNDSIFEWKSEHEVAFQKLKEKISTRPVLKYYDERKPVTIQADASSYALGCALLQEGQPVAYASKTMTASQRNYAQIEKETLAILFACRRFDQYLCGKSDTTVITDHRPLLAIFGRPLIQAPKRLQSMLMYLQRYKLRLEYRKGTEMYIADFLSRIDNEDKLPEKELEVYGIQINNKKIDEAFAEINEVNVFKYIPITDITLNKVKQATHEDKIMQKLINVIIEGWPKDIKYLDESLKIFWTHRDELITQQGMVLKGDRILIPGGIRKDILQRLHGSHQGIENTTKLARQTVFWPGITQQIKSTVQNCETCMMYARNQWNPPMKSHEIPKVPFERISADVFELVIGNKRHYFLIIVDHYSDFFEIEELHGITSKATIKSCKRVFSRYGIPMVFITDGGMNFTSNEFRKFSKEWEFNHVISSPHHQQANGKAEAAVKIAKNLILKSIEDQQDIYMSLLQLRNTPNKVNTSPAQRLFSRTLRSNIPTIQKKLKPQVQKDVYTAIKSQRLKAKSYYDRKTKQLPELHTRSNVYFKKMPSDKIWKKGRIEGQVSTTSYKVSTNDNSYIRTRAHVKPIYNQNGKASLYTRQPTMSSNMEDYSQRNYRENDLIFTNNIKGNTSNDENINKDITDTTENIHGNVQRDNMGTYNNNNGNNNDNISSANIKPRRAVQMPIRFKDYIMS